ncbi:LysR family transcriptional regulator [Paractinoplanes brasiliensis]|uniref:DNA-binding transcriptional LysR family regulator n=1 Tax=Paractinoplanes brasiliensis TaxID=52695 RepID=A0A4R6JQ24_9ACTN|nr:LysR family transcriptional regulator [Actinoplanes brasiliensis]TDO37872.1 DNA-binding transcriptional LysR family regulator [Actinoplanes brasiliensis]GID32991.1 LysR family transcriptional regulator [Actinoplanes brasiliensis]
MLELRHFEYFLAVAEERNFTRAAARLHVVQSGVSAVIKSLERELGARLLDRTSKRVELTDAGEALLPRARAAIDAVRDARDAVDEVRGGLRGTVRVGTLTSVPLIDVPALLGAFHRVHPQVRLRLIVSPRGSVGLLEGLADGSLDVAFVSAPGRPPAGLRIRQIESRRLELVLPVGHRLAGAAEVRIADLAGEPFVDFPLGYGNRTVVDRAFAAAGVQRQVAIEVTDIGSGASFVREGLGLAVLPPFVVPDDRTGLVLKTVAGADLEWPLGVAVSAVRRPSAAARALLALIDEKVG